MEMQQRLIEQQQAQQELVARIIESLGGASVAQAQADQAAQQRFRQTPPIFSE